MHFSSIKQSHFKARVMLFCGVVVMAFMILFFRLVDLQLVQGSTFRQISEENRFFQKNIPAERGIFFDRFKKALVLNKPVYFLSEKPTQIFSKESIIPHQQAVQVMIASPAAVTRRSYRSYPFSESLAGILGYVGAVTQDDMGKATYLDVQDSIGKSGLEKFLDTEIRGKDGSEVYELNARGQILRKVSEKESEPGENVTLTLDAELNQFVMDNMKDVKGAVVVGDPETGEILALVSVPTFNNNMFTEPVFSTEEAKQRASDVQKLFDDPQKVFFNRAVSGTYPPGSVFKLITALAGLEKGAFNEDTTVVDEGVLKVDDFEFGNWFYRQYGRVEGSLSVRKALARSNDIFFYKAAEWLGPQKLAESARLFGLGQVTGIELGGEAKGLVPDPAWKEKTLGEPWYLGNTYHFGIGQGDVLVTPIQIFSMTTVFANQGKRCVPHIIYNSDDSSNRQQVSCQELGYSAQFLKTVWEGMVSACSTGGTAFPFFEWNNKHEEKVGCKTGTAEFGGADEKGYRKTHGWFTAVAEIPNTSEQQNSYPKKVVITVLVESDEEQPFREGSRDAAPIALEILKWIEENRK